MSKSPSIESVQPLAVRPRVAWRMLGCGNTRGYQLLQAGELTSYLDGAARLITTESIRNFIARRVAVTRGVFQRERFGRTAA